MKSIRILSLATAIVVSLAACQPAPAPVVEEPVVVVDPAANLAPIVEASSRGQYRVAETFSDEAPEGLLGVVLEPVAGGTKMIAWSNPDGTVLMPGPLFIEDGTNLSETLLNQFAGYISNEELAGRIVQNDIGFVAGRGDGPIVTVFFEPYCGYCNRLFEQMEPLIANGTIRARFVMVGFLRPDSVARAAEINIARNPYQALQRWEARADKANAPAPRGTTPEAEAQVTASNTLMSSAGQMGTPAILICKTDGTLEMVRGMPADFSAFTSTVGATGHELCNTP